MNESSTSTNQTESKPPTSKTLGIEITQAAVDAVAQQIAKRNVPGTALRVGIRGGGCSGFSYVIEFADETTPRDQVFEFDGLKVVVDPKSLVFLNGSTLDYETRLMSHGFKFINPNESAGCGCGESFSV